MLHDDNTAGQTFELYGPKEYSTAEIAELVDREIIKHRRHLNVPKKLLKPMAHYLNKYLWWHTMSPDEVEREFIDQHIDPTAKTFKDLGIEPAELSNLTFHYLVCLTIVAIFQLLTKCRKHTEAHHSTTCRRRRSRRDGRRRSTCMFSMTSRAVHTRLFRLSSYTLLSFYIPIIYRPSASLRAPRCLAQACPSQPVPNIGTNT